MRETYIKMRNSQKYDIKWFFDYFSSKGGNLDHNSFSALFQQFADLPKILEFLDGEFKVISLHYPLESGERTVGKFIKIVN